MKKHDYYDFLDIELSDIIAVYRTKKVPVFYSSTGYGRKIPTQYVIKMTDNRIRRVYCVCFSNSGSLWVNFQGKRPFVENAILDYKIANKLGGNEEFSFLEEVKK